MASERLAYLNQLVDKLYTDNTFFAGLLSSATGPSEAKAYLAKMGFALQQSDWKLIDSLVDPGPHFNLCLAGGAYRMASNSLGIWELFVNSSEKKIYLDGSPVTSQEVQADGSVTFSSASNLSFRVTFQCAVSFGDGPYPTPQFKGEVWPTGQESAKTPVGGLRCFPWGNIFGQTSKYDYNAGITTQVSKEAIAKGRSTRDQAGLKSLAVAVDLTNYQKDKTPTLDLGDLIVNLTAFGLCMLCLVASKYDDGPGGAIIGALGAVGLRVIALDVKKWLFEESTNKLKEKIAILEYNPKEVCKNEVKYQIWRLDEKHVRRPDIAEKLRDDVKQKYVLEAMNTLRTEIVDEFQVLEALSSRDFWLTFETALGDKFDQEIPPLYLEEAVKTKLDERLKDKIITHEVTRLQEDLKKAERRKIKDLSEVSPEDPHAEEKRREIEGIFEKEKTENEKEQKAKEEEKRKLERRDFEKEYDDHLLRIEAKSEERRLYAEHLKDIARGKLAKKGYGESSV